MRTRGGGTPRRRTLEGTPRSRTQELIKVRGMKILENGQELLQAGISLTEEDILNRPSLLICEEDLHILSSMAKMDQFSSTKLRLSYLRHGQAIIK